MESPLIYLYFVIIMAINKISSSSFVLGQSHSKPAQQQRHFITISSISLNLQKSLKSQQQIRLPFDRLFSLSTQLQSAYTTDQFISFSPTTIKLSLQKRSQPFKFSSQINEKVNSHKQLQSERFRNLTVLQDLRTPFPIQISQIIPLSQNFIFLFVFPAKVIVLEQMENYIAVNNAYQVKQLNTFDKSHDKTNSFSSQNIKFYPFFDQYVIGYLQNTREFFLFDDKGYTWLKNQALVNKLQHVHAFDKKNRQFFTAERQDGFKHCRINLRSRRIQLVRKFDSFSSVGLVQNLKAKSNNLSVYDVTFNTQTTEVYFLDINLGVVRFKYQRKQQNKTYKLTQNSTYLLIEQRGCQALDYIHNNRIVLICQQRKKRFFVQAFFANQTFTKQSPVFHNCNFQDLQITSDFYIAFESSSIDIFWPSKSNFIPEMVHNKKHLNLVGLQAFKIKVQRNGQVFLYSIRNNILIKQKLEQEPYSLKIGSKLPTKIQFSIQAYGSCQVLEGNLKNQGKSYSVKFQDEELIKLKLGDTLASKEEERNKICRLKVPVQLLASQYIIQNRGKYSLAVSILVLCLLLAFILIFICLKKYVGMERIARETLQGLKKRTNIKPQFVL